MFLPYIYLFLLHNCFCLIIVWNDGTMISTTCQFLTGGWSVFQRWCNSPTLNWQRCKLAYCVWLNKQIFVTASLAPCVCNINHKLRIAYTFLLVYVKRLPITSIFFLLIYYHKKFLPTILKQIGIKNKKSNIVRVNSLLFPEIGSLYSGLSS